MKANTWHQSEVRKCQNGASFRCIPQVWPALSQISKKSGIKAGHQIWVLTCGVHHRSAKTSYNYKRSLCAWVFRICMKKENRDFFCRLTKQIRKHERMPLRKRLLENPLENNFENCLKEFLQGNLYRKSRWKTELLWLPLVWMVGPGYFCSCAWLPFKRMTPRISDIMDLRWRWINWSAYSKCWSWVMTNMNSMGCLPSVFLVTSTIHLYYRRFQNHKKIDT